MNISRLEQLNAFLEEDPNDPFNIYALALEYTKSNTDSALHYFHRLLERFPDYISTYYHLGKLYQGLDRFEEAEKTFTKGIQFASILNKTKDASELKNALQQLKDEMIWVNSLQNYTRLAKNKSPFYYV